MRQIKQSGTRPIVFLMIDSADHITGKTGLTPTVTISKDGAAFASPAGVVAEIAVGWYKLTPTSADSGTLGTLILHATATGADPVDDRYQVVAYDPENATTLGLTNLDAAITSRMATFTQPTGFLAATFPSSVASPTNITAGTITTTTNLTNAPTAGDLTATMKASVTTAATAATPAAASVSGAVGSVTGNVGGNVTGSVGSVVGAVGSVAGAVGSVTSGVTVTTNNDKTGYALASTAATLSAAERNSIADALLVRHQQGGSAGGSGTKVSDALAGGLMSLTISGGTLTVKNGDGTTAYTRTLTRSALDAIVSAA